MSSASPPSAVPRLFYHPAYWCHSCDMSINLPPSPTLTALLCPHCHRDSLEQMEMDEYTSPPPPGNLVSSTSSAIFTPPDDDFLLTSPYLHRFLHHLTTAAAESDPRSNPSLRSSIESLQELSITAETDPTLLCPVCKDPFLVNTVSKMLPCKHAYHSDCIVPWLEINNSCPVCRYKLPAVDEARTADNGGEGYIGIEELADDDIDDLFGFRNTLRHIARRHRWDEEANIGNGSEGNLLSLMQIEEVGRGDGVLENSVEMVSLSWPRWEAEERGRDDGGVALPRG